jgi:predicted HAD superfamily Cof-like phosphohydrolase
MAGFVPGRDRATLESMTPEETQSANAVESAEHRADLDKEELAELERAQTGGTVRKRNRTLLDRLLRRG